MNGCLVIIDGHPDPQRRHLCHALAAACREGALEVGKRVSVIAVADLEFPLLRSATDFNEGEVPAAIVQAQQQVQAADHLVFIYPLWLGDMPALLKGFIEQLFRPGFAIETSEHGFPKKMLRDKRATVIVTMGMPAVAYRWFFFSHTLKNFKRNVLYFCGVKPVNEVLIGGVAKLNDTKIEYWLRYARAIGSGRIR